MLHWGRGGEGCTGAVAVTGEVLEMSPGVIGE